LILIDRNHDDSSEEYSLPMDTNDPPPPTEPIPVPIRDKLSRMDGYGKNLLGLIKMIHEQIVRKHFTLLEISHMTIILEALLSCYQFAANISGSYNLSEEIDNGNRNMFFISYLFC